MLLDEINADAYYKKILSCKENRNWVLRNLKKKRYAPVMLFARMYTILRKVKQNLCLFLFNLKVIK